MHLSASLALLLPIVVSAAPAANFGPNNWFCSANDAVIATLRQQATATSFCSSYLGIQTKTFTSTATVTPASVILTIPATSFSAVKTNTASTTTTTTAFVTTTLTTTKIDTATTTTTTSTSTITCLDSAYTASAAVVQRDYNHGNNYKAPGCIPKTWPSAHVSSACACLSIPTPSTTLTVTTTLAPGTATITSTTIIGATDTATETETATDTSTITRYSTTTTTTTVTASAQATTIASNGVEYRRYASNFDAGSEDSGFTSSYFKDGTVLSSGTIDSLTFSTPDWPDGSTILTLSNGDSFDATYAALLIQGFFIANETGAYTLTASDDTIDNWGYLWVGDDAYSSWNDSNTAFQASRTPPVYIGGEYTFTMNAGDAVPITWLWANGGVTAQSQVQVTAPDGTQTDETNGYLVKACKASTFT